MAESTSVLVQTETVGATVVVTGATVLGTVPIGPQGIPGDQGDPGADGDSAYDVAVANGFVGTEAAWLASLVGAQGDAGPPGADGEGQVVSIVAGTNVTVDATDPANPVVSAAGGGGSGVVETIVAGSNIDVDATDPANPIVSVETLVDADIPASIARDSEVTAAVDAEAALARNADNLTSGTVADARIASTIARDSEVTAAIAASEAGQVRDGDAAGGVLSGTYPDPGFAVDMATQAELDSVAGTIPNTEAIQDVVGGMVTGGTETGIAVTYDDINGRLDFVAEVTQSELDAKADDSAVVHDTGDETIAGVKTFSSDPIIPDEAYDATAWNGSLEPPTKNAVRDKIESLGAGYTDEQAQDAVGAILTDTATIDLTYTDATPSITADVKDGSITAAKVAADVATQAELDAKVSDTAYNATSWNGVTDVAPSKNAVRDQVELLAPLASPALTGSPTAPTQSAADNSTKIATTAYADAKVSDTAYDATSWNAVTGIAPSKNAVRDQIEALASIYQAASSDLTDLVSRWVPASASGPASLDFLEDTDNGSNKATLIAPASMAADRTLTLPDKTGTLALTSSVVLAGPQTLTNKTTGGTTEEQWGTEELVISTSTVPSGSSVTVLAHVTGNAHRNDATTVTAERGISTRLQVSLDGGSTWTTTTVGASYTEWQGNENTNSAAAISAQILHSGTTSGDIQIRAMVTTFHQAGKPVARDGCITATVTVA